MEVFLKIIYLFLAAWVFLAACGLSLAVASRGYSLVVGHRLLIAVAFLAVETASRALRLQQLQRVGLVTLRLVESSWISDQIRVPFISRRIISHLLSQQGHLFLIMIAFADRSRLIVVGVSYAQFIDIVNVVFEPSLLL